ncbi:hypothetical protein [Tsuneonella sp. HG222]
MTKYFIAAAALALAPLGAAHAEVTVGATVYGPEGNPVGQVEAVADGVVTLNTGEHKAGLPLDRFGDSEKGPTISVTQAQLNEMMATAAAEAAAALETKLVAGASVVDVDGVAIGSVEKIEGDDVTVKTEWGAFALKKEAFLPAEAGVTAQVKADQIKTALGASAATAAS